MPPETCRVDLQRNKTSLHIVTSVGYSIEYYDARNNKYKVNIVQYKKELFLKKEIENDRLVKCAKKKLVKGDVAIN